MATVEVTYARDYDLPPVIVWDALVDSDLVEGWLAPALIDARPGGRYELFAHPVDLREFGSVRGSTGTIAGIERCRLLVVEFDDRSVRFVLEELPFGARGTSTRLRLTVSGSDDSPLDSSAWWRTSLEVLEDLLRGHPVDWETWPEAYATTWRHFRDDTPDRAAR